MREVTRSETEPNKEETTENAGYAWKTKWGVEAAPGRSRAAIAKIVGVVLVGVVALAVAVFLLVGGPSRLASRNVQRPPISSIVVPPPAEAQPAGGLENLVVPVIPPAAQ